MMKKSLLYALLLALPLLAETPAPLTCNNAELETALTELKQKAEGGDAYSARQVYMRYALKGFMKQAHAWADKFVDILRKQADAGDIIAMRFMGRAYLTGDAYLKRDEAEAANWFKRAADAGDAAAAFILAELHTKALKQEEADAAWKQSYNLYCKKADEGDNEALYWKGYMQQQALGTPAAPQEGLANMEKAAAAGCMTAAFQLFKTYTKGIGTAANEAKAFRYAKQLADEGKDPQMIYVVADAYFKGKGIAADEKTALQYLEKAVELKVPAAIYHKAWRLEEAGKNEEAYQLYRQSASMGHADAAVRMGSMQLHGKGTEKDESAGLATLQRACDRLQSAFAPYELARYYDSVGEPALANEWYVVASDRGVAEAMGRRGLMHLNPFSGVKWGPTETYRWWKQGKEAGDADCTLYYNLYFYLFIPLIIILVFALPLLVVYKANKKTQTEE